MAIKEQAMLIFTDAKNNNNKFYEVILNDDDTVNTRWGRVGTAGQSGKSPGGKRMFDSTVRAKKAKGYEPSNVMSLIIDTESQDKGKLAEVAKRDIIKDAYVQSELVKLVDRLSEMNKHQIIEASNGNIKINESGLITTPLGMVTENTIAEARKTLDNILKYVLKNNFSSDDYISLLEKYLTLIPQKVPSKRGWHETFFANESIVIAQNTFLDQLESSIDLYKTKQEEALKKSQEDKKEKVLDTVFKTSLELVTDKQILKMIEKKFEVSKNSRHVTSNFKLKNVYEIKNEEWTNRFEKNAKIVGNVQLLWHGTRAFNVLSIFKSGLIVPKSGGSYHITGRMFGDGVYFSDQSSKALNYSYGYWDNNKKDNNCFMFLADVALGKSYVPKHANDRRYPVPGHDSVFAKANVSGVMNNEMIVYDVGYANLKYLCEFSQ